MYYRGINEYGLKLAPAGPPDSTPPTAPNTITALPLNDREIELSWQPATDSETGIVLYNVFRDGVQIATVKGWSYTDTGLVEQTDYSYEISAVNYHGLEGPRGGPIIAATLVDVTPPQIISVNTGNSANQVIIEFNEPVAGTDVQAATNYFTIRQDVAVTGGSLAGDLQTVTLATTGHVHDNYLISVNGLHDQAATPNPIVPSSRVDYIYTGIDGLVGAWSFDERLCAPEGAGEIALDTSNFGNDGMLFALNGSGPTAVSGFIGKALNFDGLDDQVTIEASQALKKVTDSSHTFAAWVYPDSVPPSTTANDIAYTILARAYTGLYYDADRTFRTEVQLSDGTRVPVSSGVFAPGAWHQVIMTVDDSQKKLHLYVDGQEVSNSPVSYTGSLAEHEDAPYYVGTSEPLANRYEYRFSGMIDETRIFNQSLSLAEVGTLFSWSPAHSVLDYCMYEIHIPMISVGGGHN
jgi:hypothetical protein